MTTVQRIAFWQLVHEYVAACGGDSSAATVSARRERAVAALEQEIDPWLAPACEHDQARRENVTLLEGEAEEAYWLLVRAVESLSPSRGDFRAKRTLADIRAHLKTYEERHRRQGGGR